MSVMLLVFGILTGVYGVLLIKIQLMSIRRLWELLLVVAISLLPTVPAVQIALLAHLIQIIIINLFLEASAEFKERELTMEEFMLISILAIATSVLNSYILSDIYNVYF